MAKEIVEKEIIPTVAHEFGREDLNELVAVVNQLVERANSID